MDNRSLKVSEEGATELLRLQGGAIAGEEEHRQLLQEVKDIFDIMGFLTNMPYQLESTSNPDLIIKSSMNEDGCLFFVEIEVGTRRHGEGRLRKAENARLKGATPVFVYEDIKAAELAFMTIFVASVFWFMPTGNCRATLKEGFCRLRVWPT